MDGPNLQIRDCTTVAYDYLQTRSDKNSVALQKQLQNLSSVTDLEIFEATSSETLELYLCLGKFLTPCEARSTVAGKVLALLTHISVSPAVRVALRDEIKLVPVLSNFLVSSKLSRDNLLKTLNLLNDISCRLKVVHLEGWLMDVVPYLATTVTEGNMGDESLLLALQVLGNLCRSSPVVVDCLYHLPNNKLLLETLSLMKNATMYIRLLAAEMMFFIDPAMNIADILNDEILDMTFTVAIEGVEENKASWVQLAADVFEELTRLPSLQTVLREYKNYATYLQLLLGCMTPDIPELLNEALMGFVHHLVKFNHQDIRSLHDTIFSKVVQWIQSQKCGQVAIQVMRELLAASGMNALSQASMDSLVTAIKNSLSCEESEVSLTELQHISIVLGLVEHVSSTSEPLQVKFALKLEPSIFSNILKTILLLNSHHTAGQDLVSGDKLTTNPMSDSGYDAESARHGAPAFRYDLKSSQKITLSKTVINIVAVTKYLGSIKPEHMAEYKKMMGMPAVMSHIMWAVHSGLAEYVTRALTLISNGSLSKECLDALVVAATEESPSKVNESLHGSHTMLFGLQKHVSTFSTDIEEKVDTIIDRLGGRIRNMELNDCALTDVFNVYEYKLASMTHYEKSLQDALKNANIHNRQTHHMHLQTKVQNDHLRSLLAKWENRFQKSQEEKSELQEAIKELEESSRQFKESFIDEKEKLERQTRDLKRELLALTGTFKAAEEKNSKLQHQLSNKVEEIKNLRSQIQDEQERISKLSKQVQKQEEELKLGVKNIEKLKKEVENLESTKLRLEKENSDLELLVKNKDESIAAKEEELEETIIKLNKLAEIQNMIHDISSRRVIK